MPNTAILTKHPARFDIPHELVPTVQPIPNLIHDRYIEKPYGELQRDAHNRLIVSVKFCLAGVKPYLIMLTKNKTQEIIYQCLQFLSLVIISYLTYSKIYYQSFEIDTKSDGAS